MILFPSKSQQFILLSIFFICALMFNTAYSQPLTLVKSKPFAPDFELRDMDDEIHRLADYKGKPVIINFWATWCPPCRAELPSMNRAWQKIKNDGIAMIAINIGEQEDTVFEFASQFPISFMVLLDERADEMKKWPMTGLPTTFILDPEGRIVYKAVGDKDWDDDALLDMIRALRINQ